MTGQRSGPDRATGTAEGFQPELILGNADDWWRDCAERFSELPAYLVGVRCSLEVLEQREKARRNRTLGQARAQFGVVHGLEIYDLEVDTSILTPEECARQIKALVEAGIPPNALKNIKERI